MRTPALSLLLFLSISGCSFLSQQPDGDPVRGLRRAVDGVLSDSLFIPASASVKIVSAETGEVLYDRNSARLMRPASNMKLLTTAAALTQVGPSYAFRTLLAVDATPFGPLSGNVYLKGFGDPDLRDTDLDSLAGILWDRGIRTIGGDIVADATWFDAEYWGPGWMWDDEPDPDGAPISALSVNKNCVTVIAAPDTVRSGLVAIAVQPPTDYVSVISCARAVSDTPGFPLTVDRLFRDHSNTITVRGDVRVGTPPTSVRVTVWQPELYAAQLLREACVRRGILIGGSTRFGPMPPDARPVADIRRTFDSVIVNLNKVSDNLSAECTLKALGAAGTGTQGTTAAGASVVKRMLDGFGIDTTRCRIMDGSGLSYYNLLSADLLVRLLLGMSRRSSIFPVFLGSLPIAGRDGTLAHRMKQTPAEDNVRAKTGTLAGVSSLSGYARSREGELLVFSILMQNFIGSADRYRMAQDSIAVLLSTFARHPVLARQ